MKKDIGIIKMSLTFAGCFLGAGYVSGQELWQYFGSYGTDGFAGLLLALILMVLTTLTVMWIALVSGKTAMDDVISPWNIPFLKRFFGWSGVVMFFSIAAIMTAGIGGLFVSMLGLPAWTGCLMISVLAAVVAFKGLDGMIAVFSSSVPLLVASAVVISAARLGSIRPEELELSGSGVNPMLGSWPLAAVNYMAFNIYGAIALLSPLAKRVKGGMKGIAVSVSAGGMILFLIAALIIFSIAGTRSAADAELPMLMIAGLVSPAAMWVYGILIFIAMYGITMSSYVAVTEYFNMKKAMTKKERKTAVCVLGVLCFLASFFGFSNLISYAYPVFGYIGFISILFLLFHAWMIKKAG